MGYENTKRVRKTNQSYSFLTFGRLQELCTEYLRCKKELDELTATKEGR